MCSALRVFPHLECHLPIVVGQGRFELPVRGFETPLRSKRLAHAIWLRERWRRTCALPLSHSKDIMTQ